VLRYWTWDPVQMYLKGKGSTTMIQRCVLQQFLCLSKKRWYIGIAFSAQHENWTMAFTFPFLNTYFFITAAFFCIALLSIRLSWSYNFAISSSNVQILLLMTSSTWWCKILKVKVSFAQVLGRYSMFQYPYQDAYWYLYPEDFNVDTLFYVSVSVKCICPF